MTKPATLVITDQDQSREVRLPDHGVLIGRDPECDVVLPSERVSRHHARLFPDPFGRWIIEDEGSRHGIWLGERRLQAHALLPGEQLRIGPHYLSLVQEVETDIAADPAVTASTRLWTDDQPMQMRAAGAAAPGALSRQRLQEVQRLAERLEQISTPADLYPTLCRELAAAPRTVALVLRLPAEALAAGAAPAALAWHAGAGAAAGTLPALHLSRRVLEAVRAGRGPVLAQSTASDDADLLLTVADATQPRAVLAAPVGEGTGGTLEVLYLDAPLEAATDDVMDYFQTVVRQVRLARKGLLLVEARAEHRALDQELELARKMQGRLTPRQAPAVPGLDMAFHYQPAFWVGGDYCDFWPVPDGRLAFVVADVVGKGLPAALVMANMQAALRTTSRFCAGPAAAMEEMARHLVTQLQDELFITAFLGYLDPRTGGLEYVNAGHIPPWLRANGGAVRCLGLPKNGVLGAPQEAFEAETLALDPETTLVVVTDGVTESRSRHGEQLGRERVGAALEACPGAAAADVVQHLTAAAEQFRHGLPPQDDLTILALRWRGVPA